MAGIVARRTRFAVLGSMPQGSPIKTQRPVEEDFDRQQSYTLPEGMERVPSSVGGVGGLTNSMSIYSPAELNAGPRGGPGEFFSEFFC